MTKHIKNSLTVKICILIAVLLLVASAATYGMIAHFLPTYYSSQLEQDLDRISRDMVETISSFSSIEEASNALALFAAGSQVFVTVLDEEGNTVWPEEQEQISYEEREQTGYVCIGDSYISYSVSAGETEMASDEVIVFEESILWSDADLEIGISSAVQHYEFEMGGKPYMMIVSGGMQPVNQAMGILSEIFPYIFGVALVMAVLFALAASLYLTAPIVSLSRISEKMAALDFADHYQGRRSDEIGLLGSSLNKLSENLSGALNELRRANEKLRSDIELEREQERKRIAFFSAVSHELKTPITILKGHLYGMLQGVGEYRNRDYYLQRSSETAEKMERLVQELLTVSRIESNVFTVRRTDLAELLRLQIADFAELIEEKTLALEVQIPEHLYADVNENMMEKVFANLILNAIRYTPEGNEIRVKMEAESEEIRFQIENTGTFIPEEALPHLFEAFYRVDASRSRQTGGTGLGLYIVKMILEQHRAGYAAENTADGVCVRFFMEATHKTHENSK